MAYDSSLFSEKSDELIMEGRLREESKGKTHATTIPKPIFQKFVNAMKLPAEDVLIKTEVVFHYSRGQIIVTLRRKANGPD